MLVLLAAAVVAAAPAPLAQRDSLPMPNLYKQPAHCGPVHEGVMRRIRTAERGAPRLLRYAVERTVDGCAAPAPAGYRQDYLLPGRADEPPYRPVSDGAATKR